MLLLNIENILSNNTSYLSYALALKPTMAQSICLLQAQIERDFMPSGHGVKVFILPKDSNEEYDITEEFSTSLSLFECPSVKSLKEDDALIVYGTSDCRKVEMRTTHWVCTTKYLLGVCDNVIFDKEQNDVASGHQYDVYVAGIEILAHELHILKEKGLARTRTGETELADFIKNPFPKFLSDRTSLRRSGLGAIYVYIVQGFSPENEAWCLRKTFTNINDILVSDIFISYSAACESFYRMGLNEGVPGWRIWRTTLEDALCGDEWIYRLYDNDGRFIDLKSELILEAEKLARSNPEQGIEETGTAVKAFNILGNIDKIKKDIQDYLEDSEEYEKNKIKTDEIRENIFAHQDVLKAFHYFIMNNEFSNEPVVNEMTPATLAKLFNDKKTPIQIFGLMCDLIDNKQDAYDEINRIKL